MKVVFALIGCTQLFVAGIKRAESAVPSKEYDTMPPKEYPVPGKGDFRRNVSPARVGAIAELDAPDMFLGMSIEHFIRQHPDAVISGQREGAEQYWLRRKDGSLMLVAFRAGGIAMLSLAASSLTEDEKIQKTRSLVSALSRRYGEPRFVPAGKVLRDGVVHAASLVYDLGGGVSVILQSTAIELSITQADFGKVEFGRVVVPYEELKKRLRQESQPHEQPVFKDHLKTVIESATHKKLDFSGDVEQSLLKLHLSTSGGHPSDDAKLGPFSMNPFSGSARWGSLVTVLGIGAAWLVRLMLKGRK